MRKRDFLAGAAMAAGVWPSGPALAARTGGPVLLTVSGAIGKTNRRSFDAVLDQMMSRHGISFDKAFTFDAQSLDRLPKVGIRPTLEYDAKVHQLRGPLLTSVLQATGVSPDAVVQLGLRAVDGYNVAIGLQDARQYRMLLATEIDGQPLALGGLGPQWAVFDADRILPFSSMALKERFALCPWGLYHVAVGSA